jgi:hypothetical protein
VAGVIRAVEQTEDAMRRLIILLIVAAMLAAPSPAAPPSTQSIVDHARSAFASGDYAGCLRAVSRLLGSNAAPPGTVERYDLLLLRGECLLALRQQAAAAEVFEAAANVLNDRGDLKQTAAAKALAVLVRASPGLKYGSKTTSPGGIDIVDPATRKDAINALRADRRAALAPDIEKALLDNSVIPTQELLPALWELYALEYVATGDVAETMADLVQLGQHARNLTAAEFARVLARLKHLRDLSREPALSDGPRQMISYRGLNSHDSSELQELANYLVKIQAALGHARRVSRLIGSIDEEEKWNALLADCAAARDIAEQAYAWRY